MAWIFFLWSFICFYGASDDGVWRWLVILGWPVLVWIVIVIHELGHAAAAVAIGWRVVAIAMGPFAFHLINRDFAIVPRSKRTEFEGFVVAVPVDQAAWTIPREALISAGGPFANLLLAALLFTTYWGSPNSRSHCQLSSTPPPFQGGLPEQVEISWLSCLGPQLDWSLIIFGTALVSLWLGIGNLMPADEGDSATDGEHLLSLRRTNRDDWRKYRAFIRLRGLLEYQLRLRDLPLWILDEAAEVAAQEGGAFQQSHATMLIGIVLDSPPVDQAQARAMLDEYRDRYGPSEWLDSCDAYFTAVWEGNGKKARSLLWQGEKHPEMKALSLAAEAAALASEGNADAAAALLQKMREANRARSIFPDHTFRDIGRQIEAILPA